MRNMIRGENIPKVRTHVQLVPLFRPTLYLAVLALEYRRSTPLRLLVTRSYPIVLFSAMASFC